MNDYMALIWNTFSSAHDAEVRIELEVLEDESQTGNWREEHSKGGKHSRELSTYNSIQILTNSQDYISTWKIERGLRG